MSMAVTRAAQNSYPNTVTGGTQDIWTEPRNISVFMDAVEREDTPFLNNLKKGSAGRDRKEYTAIHSVTPRGSVVAAAVSTGASSITLPTGHGFRFQQANVIKVTAANGDEEIMWVNADPDASSLSVKRAQGGTSALAFAGNEKIAIIGTALPQLADFPMGPVSRGRYFWNTYQKFATHLTYSAEARKTGTTEYPSGDQLERDMLQKGKDLKAELNQALINGRRQEGSPDPSDPIPAMFGGLRFFAAQSGNVFTIGTSSTLLTFDAVNEAVVTLDEKIGEKKGLRALMSPRTKQVFNRIANPARYQFGLEGRAVETRVDKIMTDVGDITFEFDRHLPDGEIYLFKDGGMEYAPFEGLDWKGKDVPTKGDYTWRGLSGTFTFRPGAVPAMALIKGFSTDTSAYPTWGAAS